MKEDNTGTFFDDLGNRETFPHSYRNKMEALEEKAGEFNRKRAENEHAEEKLYSQIERKRHAGKPVSGKGLISLS